MGKDGAACFHTLSPDTENIPEPQWDQTRFGMICEDSTSFADWKKVIEELCSVSKDCSYDTTQKIENFFSKVEAIKAVKTGLTQP